MQAKTGKHISWCINNGIYISPFAKVTYEWYVDIEINGKTNRYPQCIWKNDIWEQIFEYCKYYYNKKYDKNKI